MSFLIEEPEENSSRDDDTSLGFVSFLKRLAVAVFEALQES